MTNSEDPDQLADLDLHCLQRQGIGSFSWTRVKLILIALRKIIVDDILFFFKSFF